MSSDSTPNLPHLVTQHRPNQHWTPYGLMDDCDIEDCFGIPGALEKRFEQRQRERERKQQKK